MSAHLTRRSWFSMLAAAFAQGSNPVVNRVVSPHVVMTATQARRAMAIAAHRAYVHKEMVKLNDLIGECLKKSPFDMVNEALQKGPRA